MLLCKCVWRCKGTLFVTQAATASQFKTCEDAPSSTPHVLGDAAFVILLDERHRLQALCALQETNKVALVKAFLPVRRFTRHDSRLIAETDAPNLGSLVNKVASMCVAIPFLLRWWNALWTSELHCKKSVACSFLQQRWLILSQIWFRLTSWPAIASDTPELYPGNKVFPSTPKYS